MYACLCRGITVKQVKDAVQDGVCCNSQLSKYVGVKPDCGTCGMNTKKIINQTLTTKRVLS